MSQSAQTETFIVIFGRTRNQRTALNEGKFATDSIQETGTVLARDFRL
jgi:hypothetical protein